MGYLSRFDIGELIKVFNLEYFIETGLGEGKGLYYALYFPFKEYHSIEISQEMFDQGIKKFSNLKKENIKLHLGTTRDILPLILNLEGNILFWMDAHLPDWLWGKSFSHLDKDLKLPLEEELKIIQKHRPNNKDVFLCDDLRIYEDGSFEAGNWAGRLSYDNAAGGTKFIYDLFSKTHIIEKDYKHEGYITLLPRGIKK
jgi:hypothetical protein